GTGGLSAAPLAPVPAGGRELRAPRRNRADRRLQGGACQHHAGEHDGPGRILLGDAMTNLTIDFHCHVLTIAAESVVADRPQKLSEPGLMLKSMGEASVAHNNAVMLPCAFPKLTRVEDRLADMNAMGVDVQVLSPSPTQYYYWADREL